MKIQSLAKAIIMPVLLFPIQSKGNDKTVDKGLHSPITLEKVLPTDFRFINSISPTVISTFALPKSIEKYKITEVITDPERIGSKYDAYYKVETNKEGYFYIARQKNGRTDTLFGASFDLNEKNKGLVFPDPIDNSGLVALVDAKEAGLNGVFEIYDNNAGYIVQYNFSPLISTPGHTTVSSTYLIDMENMLRKLPSSYTAEIAKQGIRVLMAKNVEDAYYYYYPSWKREDDSKVVDPKRPPYEFTENGYRDYRKYANIGGLYIDRKAIIPQTYIRYGTNDEIIDYAKSVDDTRYVAYHELGHGFDDLYYSRFSDSKEFKKAHSKDISTFSKEDKDRLIYFYNRARFCGVISPRSPIWSCSSSA